MGDRDQNGLAANGHDLSTQLAMMQKLMAEQAAQMEEQRRLLEQERSERSRREEELKTLKSGSQMESGVYSGPTSSSVQSSYAADTELEMLRRQLEERERELRKKEEEIKERDDRLSLLTQRSDSVMSEDPYYNGLVLKMQNGEIPTVKTSICECTTRGFKKCILYKRDICTCSYSCQFVKEYFKPPKGSSFFLT